jgi:hypothetical protein
LLKLFWIYSKHFDNVVCRYRPSGPSWCGTTIVFMVSCAGLLLAQGELAAHAAAGASTGEGRRPTETVSLDRLSDLSNRMAVIVTLVGRDSFTNEFSYEVSVKNQSPESFNTDDMILVLDDITDLAGKGALDRLEVVNPDGKTVDGKAYFRVPRDGTGKLTPYGDGVPAVIRLRNVNYTAVFTPSFRVFGLLQRSGKPQVELSELIQLLLKKGLVTDEELRTLKAK